MKTLLRLLFLFSISGNTFSQSLTEEMTSVLIEVGKKIPSDKLFLHSDRNLYHPGDTIWFKAYIRDSRTGKFEAESSSLYVMLLNSGHFTIDSARFRIMYASVSAWLKVPDDAPAGDYSILAFTSGMMNYSPEYSFTSLVRIDKIMAAGSMPGRDHKNEAATISQIPGQLPQLDLRFLPEGGTFIAGIKQRLAFNAVRSNGKVLQVNGTIKNQKDEKITEFRSTSYGPGVVEFAPVQGDSYFAELDGEEFKGVKWSLPAAEGSGVCLRINNTGDGMTDIILKGKGISGKSWLLTVTMNNILVFAEDIRFDTLCKKRIQTDKLPSGTAFITLYDSELNPVSERLVFLNDFKKMNVSIGVSSSLVLPGDETELTINTTDNKGNNISSVVSVAVIDSLSGYYNIAPVPEIESAYLYDRDFYNNLPFRIISEGLENMDPKSIDILLMTYGWRKFYPKEVNVENSDQEFVNYDYLTIVNKGPARRCRSDISLISNASLDIITLPVNNDREALLLYDSLDPGVREILILPDKEPIKNTGTVKIVFPENKDFTEKAKLLASEQNSLMSDLPLVGIINPLFNLGDVIVFEPVTIKAPAQPKKKYEDKYATMFQYAGSRTMTRKDFREAACFEDILYKYNPFQLNNQNASDGLIKEKYIYLRANEHITGGHFDDQGNYSVDHGMYPALLVVDNNPLGLSYETISQMPASEIVSVTFLKGVQGMAMYGPKARGGVVFVTTRMGRGSADDSYDEDEVRRDDDLLKEIKLFRTETTYYIPTKEEIAQLPGYKFRPTILWKADLLIDGTGPVKIRYPNNLVKGTAMVFVNGFSFSNQVGSKRCSYKVQ